MWIKYITLFSLNHFVLYFSFDDISSYSAKTDKQNFQLDSHFFFNCKLFGVDELICTKNFLYFFFFCVQYGNELKSNVGRLVECVLSVHLVYADCVYFGVWTETATGKIDRVKVWESERLKRNASATVHCSCTHGEMKVKLKLKLLPYMFTVYYIHGILFYVQRIWFFFSVARYR